MTQDITNYIKNCEICQRNGTKYTQTKNSIINTTRPNMMWQTDLVGPINDKTGEKHFILVAIDHFSKWAETALIKEKQGIKVANCIESLIIKKHGIPEMIYSDNGTEFSNTHIKALCKKYSFEWKYRSPYHSKSTGCVERANQTIFSKIKKLSEYDNKDWKQFYRQATYAYNISFHTALQTSPIIFKYGTSPTLPVDSFHNIPDRQHDIGEIVTTRNAKFDAYAKKYIQKGKKKDNRCLNVGDAVLLYKEGNLKLEANWHKGFVVIKKLNENSFLLEKEKKFIRANKSMVRKDESTD